MSAAVAPIVPISAGRKAAPDPRDKQDRIAQALARARARRP